MNCLARARAVGAAACTCRWLHHAGLPHAACCCPLCIFPQDIKLLQQNLLEEDDTLKRLQKEKDVLGETVRYYSAAAALKSAFSTPSTSSSSSSFEPSLSGSGSSGVAKAETDSSSGAAGASELGGSSSGGKGAPEAAGSAEAEARVTAEKDETGKEK
jgi:hypothetical protein